MKINIKRLLLSVAFTEGAGIIGSIFTAPAIQSWYITLQKPFFTPPNWLFAPVWTMLFFLMGISLYRIWVKEHEKKSLALKLFYFQLTANIAWSLLFFGIRNPLLGLIDILILLIIIAMTIKVFKKIDSIAAYLLTPYIAWVGFATMLNAAVWMLN